MAPSNLDIGVFLPGCVAWALLEIELGEVATRDSLVMVRAVLDDQESWPSSCTW